VLPETIAESAAARILAGRAGGSDREAGEN
jgi:hypothetical protein